MNKLLLTILLSISTVCLYAQEIKSIENTQNKIKSSQSTTTTNYPVRISSSDQSSSANSVNYPVTYSIGKNGVQKVHDKAYYQQQLTAVNYLIEAIDTKVEYIKSDQTQRLEAEKNGWFKQMETNKMNAQRKKAELIKKIQTL